MRAREMLGMTTKLLRASLVLVLLVVVGCAKPQNPDEDAGWVVERFIVARQDRNLDATMDCFVDRPEMRSSLGVGWSGRDAVRAIMASRLADTYVVGDMRAVGNRVVWTEHVLRSVAGAQVANFDEDVEAIVVGGRIGSMVTYVGGAHPQPAEATGQVSVSLDLLAPLGTLLLVAAAVLVWPHAPLQSRRTASGQLLEGLRAYVARRG
ncbi:MAG TPA: hypothetical protein VKV73_00490 [Chloroflexota bacterium]|nr:hypothetical protein [Chloroflexota bacterium]